MFETGQDKLLVFRQHGRIIEFDCPAYEQLPFRHGEGRQFVKDLC
jgi:hypothetical protein